MPYPHWTWKGKIWANVDRRFRHRARLRFQPWRRTRRTGTSVRWRTTAEKTRDCAAPGAGRNTWTWERAGESATAAVPLRFTSPLVTFLRWIFQLWPIVRIPATARVHMSTQVARSIRSQVLRRELGVQRVWQQSKRQEVESTRQAGGASLRACSGRKVQPRATSTTHENGQRARVVLHRRRSHGAGEKDAHAQLRHTGSAWVPSTILDSPFWIDDDFDSVVIIGMIELDADVTQHAWRRGRSYPFKICIQAAIHIFSKH